MKKASLSRLNDLNSYFKLFSNPMEVESLRSSLIFDQAFSENYFKKVIISNLSKFKDFGIQTYLETKHPLNLPHPLLDQTLIDNGINGINYSSFYSNYNLLTYGISLDDLHDEEKLLKFYSSFVRNLLHRFLGLDRIVFLKSIIDQENSQQNSISSMINLYLVLKFVKKTKLSPISELAYNWEDEKLGYFTDLLEVTETKLLAFKLEMSERWTRPNRRITLGMLLEKMIYFKREEVFNEFKNELPELITLLTFLED